MGRGGQGRPARPTSLKVLRGERPSRINRNEPLPTDTEVCAPSWLGEAALAVWDHYAPDLVAKGVLTPWDAEHFAVWCDAAARRREASAALHKQGSVIEAAVFDRNGRVTGHRLVRNPWVLVEKAYSESILRYGARFGMTPSDRAQLRVDVPTRRGSDDLLS